MTSYISQQNNKIYNCSYCLTDKSLGSIKNNKFLIDPNLWNFEVLHCGHIICKNCFNDNHHLIDKCSMCRKDVKVYEVKMFYGINYDKYWKTLSEWFSDFNRRTVMISLKNWKANKDSFTGIYAMIRDNSITEIRLEKYAVKQLKEKRRKKKSILTNKIKRELQKITPKRQLRKEEYEKLLEKAKLNVKRNSGTFTCELCQRQLPSKHKDNHLKKCSK
jgi:hypothetical protein